MAYAADGVFHTGMAALNLFGIRSFISGPPNISGGFGFSFQGGALAVSFQQLAISNPAALRWIADELAPAVIGVFASRVHIQGQGNLLGEPGGRPSSGKQMVCSMMVLAGSRNSKAGKMDRLSSSGGNRDLMQSLVHMWKGTPQLG